MRLPLVFQAGVRDDIDEAYAWYESRRAGLGEDFLAELQRVLDRIEQNPEIQASIDQTVRRGRMDRFPYAAYYRIEPARIVIIAIQHGRRDPRRWKSRTDPLAGE